MKLYVILGIISCLFCTFSKGAQNDDASLNLGPKVLKITEPFVITVTINNLDSRPSILFPEITGLEKRSKSATSSINSIDGKKIVTQTISQEYFALKAGTYQIPDINIQAHTFKLHADATKVVFQEANEESSIVEEDVLPEIENVSEGIFFSVQADRRKVYTREGFGLRISLYVAEDAPLEMEFYKFNEQLQNILKKVKPGNCWEENAGLEEIVKNRIRIKGRSFSEYNMYQAQFFPLSAGTINLPSVTLDMVLIDRATVVNVEKRVVRSFRSKPITIQVMPLPPHAQRDQVAVGVYKLNENLSSNMVYPGQSIRYEFKVIGKGNIAAIPDPEIQPNSVFDIYPPEIDWTVKRNSAGVTGEKSFEYFVVPRKDGKYSLSRYFQWIYFNSETARYDTLLSSKILEVRGEDYKLGNISLSGSMGLYDNLETLDTTRNSINYKELIKNIANGVVIVLLLIVIWIFRK